MTLREWQKGRLCELRGRAFPKLQYTDRVTLVIYSREDHRHLGENFYYTTLLKFLPSTWFRFRFPSEREAFRFAFDNLGGHVSLPLEAIHPFGFHGKPTAELMMESENWLPMV